MVPVLLVGAVAAVAAVLALVFFSAWEEACRQRDSAVRRAEAFRGAAHRLNVRVHEAEAEAVEWRTRCARAEAIAAARIAKVPGTWEIRSWHGHGPPPPAAGYERGGIIPDPGVVA